MMEIMKSSPVMTFPLKQLTPLIHFKSDEDGACLRASEVKPKLDQFLIAVLGGEEKIPEKWFIDHKKHSALNYKMRIIASGTPSISEPSKQYLGNMGIKDPKEKKQSVFYKDPIQLVIVCSHKDLSKAIRDHLSCFFYRYNFGARQNKGFGSFLIAGDGDGQKHFETMLPPHYLRISFSEIPNFKPLELVDVLYQLMKSGYNYKGEYFKGFLFQYMLSRKMGNEKFYAKSLYKEKLPEEVFKTSRSKQDENRGEIKDCQNAGIGEKQIRFVRVMLGYASGYQMMFRGKMGSAKVSLKHPTIQRFKSPVTFKVTDNAILVLPEAIPKALYNQTFNMGLSYQTNDAIQSPAQEEFNINEFIVAFGHYLTKLQSGVGLTDNQKQGDVIPKLRPLNIQVISGEDA